MLRAVASLAAVVGVLVALPDQLRNTLAVGAGVLVAGLILVVVSEPLTRIGRFAPEGWSRTWYGVYKQVALAGFEVWALASTAAIAILVLHIIASCTHTG